MANDFNVFFERSKRKRVSPLVLCNSGHVLQAVENNKDWSCDANDEPSGCVRLDVIDESPLRYRCEECDYDLCDLCYWRRCKQRNVKSARRKLEQPERTFDSATCAVGSGIATEKCDSSRNSKPAKARTAPKALVARDMPSSASGSTSSSFVADLDSIDPGSPAPSTPSTTASTRPPYCTSRKSANEKLATIYGSKSQSDGKVAEMNTEAPQTGTQSHQSQTWVKRLAFACTLGHKLMPLANDHDNWICDGTDEPGGCRSESCLQASQYRHHCDICDYDLCDRCVQEVVHDVPATDPASPQDLSEPPRMPLAFPSPSCRIEADPIQPIQNHSASLYCKPDGKKRKSKEYVQKPAVLRSPAKQAGVQWAGDEPVQAKQRGRSRPSSSFFDLPDGGIINAVEYSYPQYDKRGRRMHADECHSLKKRKIESEQTQPAVTPLPDMNMASLRRLLTDSGIPWSISDSLDQLRSKSRRLQ